MDWFRSRQTAPTTQPGQAPVGAVPVRSPAGPSSPAPANGRQPAGGTSVGAAPGRQGPSTIPRRPGSKGLGRRSLDALRVAVLVLDDQDHPVVANPSSREMGLLRAGVSGGPPVAHTVVRTLAGQARRTGTRREVELELPRGGGREPLAVHIRAVALGDGHVTIEAADVTDAHRLARVRRDFVANVSHELKTPVGALRLLAEALLDATEPGTSDPESARRFAERIAHESGRLGRLVSELLELSRVQGGEPLPEPVPVSVDRIVAEVVDRNRTEATAKGIELIFTGTRGLRAYGSESQLMTALANLVENAVAYSLDAVPEAPAPRVTIDAIMDEGIVEITVTDEGIGIEPKDLDRIFERFYRADRARSRATGGTGLGLAIVKHIATNHGGQVSVRSQPGEGSTFTLRLPAVPLDAPPPQPASAELAAEESGNPVPPADTATGARQPPGRGKN